MTVDKETLIVFVERTAATVVRFELCDGSPIIGIQKSLLCFELYWRGIFKQVITCFVSAASISGCGLCHDLAIALSILAYQQANK
jgi:hypothetical protein